MQRNSTCGMHHSAISCKHVTQESCNLHFHSHGVLIISTFRQVGEACLSRFRQTRGTITLTRVGPSPKLRWFRVVLCHLEKPMFGFRLNVDVHNHGVLITPTFPQVEILVFEQISWGAQHRYSGHSWLELNCAVVWSW